MNIYNYIYIQYIYIYIYIYIHTHIHLDLPTWKKIHPRRPQTVLDKNVVAQDEMMRRCKHAYGSSILLLRSFAPFHARTQSVQESLVMFFRAMKIRMDDF